MASASFLGRILLLLIYQRTWAAPLGPATDLEVASKPPLLYITLEEHYDSHVILPFQEEDPVYHLGEPIISPEQNK